MLLHNIINYALSFALSRLKHLTGDNLDAAIDTITPIFAAMFANAITTGSLKIPAGTRAEYELQALKALQDAGLVEEF